MQVDVLQTRSKLLHPENAGLHYSKQSCQTVFKHSFTSFLLVIGCNSQPLNALHRGVSFIAIDAPCEDVFHSRKCKETWPCPYPPQLAHSGDLNK